jgi:hypothetical protein
MDATAGHAYGMASLSRTVWCRAGSARFTTQGIGMPINYLTMSRQALYELVWSKPMTEVAAEFGISDVALAKRCASVEIPVPPRGYWARVQAGQKPRRPALPTHRSKGGLSTDTEVEVPKRSPDPPRPAPPPPTASEINIRERLESFVPAVPDDLTSACSAVKRTAIHLKLSKVSDFTWAKGERSGPILRVDGTDAARTRGLRILDGVLKAAFAAGFTFEADPPNPARTRARYGSPPEDHPEPGRIVVDGEAFRLRIDERRAQKPHVPTEDEIRRRKRGEYVYAPAFDHSPTGELRLHLTDPDGRDFTAFKDGTRKKLEDQISAVLNALIERSQQEKRWREERRLSELAERRRQEAAWRQSQRRDLQGKFVAELERQAGAWTRARMLRRYLRAARRALAPGQVLNVAIAGTTEDFLDWAERYVDQMDPLTPAPRNPDQQPNDSNYYRADEEAFKASIQRLLGQNWAESLKLTIRPGATESPPDSAET